MGVVDPATPIRWTLQCSSDGKYYERRHRLLPRQRTYPTRNETAPQKSEWTRLARKTQIQKRRLWKNKFEKRKPEPGKKFVKMAQEGGKQQNTAYGVFVQACWAQHKRQYPDELIHKEIEEFNKQCSVWWYNLSEQERERFQEMADRSNAQQALQQYTYTAQVNNNLVTSSAVHTSSASQGTIPSFGSSFNYSDYGMAGGSGQVVNAVVDNSGTVLNYSTNSAPAQTQVMRQVGGATQAMASVTGQVQQKMQTNTSNVKPNQKPIKDPNAPKKPLSAYFLFSQDERLKVKAEFADYSITDVAKELGRRWATIDPLLKQQYEQRYQSARKVFDQEMSAYKPHKKKKDP